MKRASVIALGNILRGDLGAGCYIVDALCREPLEDSVELCYLAEDSFYAGALIYGADFAVIVQAVNMGGPTGSVSCWDKNTFLRNIGWFIETSPPNRSLAHSLGRAGLIDGLPDDLLFVWIEPDVTEGLGISHGMRRSLRRTIKIIKDNLYQRGFLSEAAYGLSSIYRLELLGTTV